MLTRRKFLGMMGRAAGAFAAFPFLKPVVESIPDKPSIDQTQDWGDSIALCSTSHPYDHAKYACSIEINRDMFENDIYGLARKSVALRERMAAQVFNDAFTFKG